MASRNTNTGSINFEQRAQTVIQLLICGAVIWGGSSLIDLGKSVTTLQATTTLTTAQTTKDIADLKNGLEAVRTQALNATTAATAATTAATTAAAVAATAVSTAAALAGAPNTNGSK
ncbi:MAG: hypothetical protein JJD98_00250 [Polaromonas sp.]|nr:hypothetical protein [Polaromonas sp.]